MERKLEERLAYIRREHRELLGRTCLNTRELWADYIFTKDGRVALRKYMLNSGIAVVTTNVRIEAWKSQFKLGRIPKSASELYLPALGWKKIADTDLWVQSI